MRSQVQLGNERKGRVTFRKLSRHPNFRGRTVAVAGSNSRRSFATRAKFESCAWVENPNKTRLTEGTESSHNLPQPKLSFCRSASVECDLRIDSPPIAPAMKTPHRTTGPHRFHRIQFRLVILLFSALALWFGLASSQGAEPPDKIAGPGWIMGTADPVSPNHNARAEKRRITKRNWNR